jgi:transketolase
VSWRVAIERRDGPTCLVFSRQNLAHQARDAQQLAQSSAAATCCTSRPAGFDLLLLATGSEVELAMQAAKQLAGEGRARARGPRCPRPTPSTASRGVARGGAAARHAQARGGWKRAVTDYWRKYVGLDGEVVGIGTASAPRRRSTPSTSTSASPWTRWSRPARRVLA